MYIYLFSNFLHFQLHIGATTDPQSPDTKEVDFFAEHSDSLTHPEEHPVSMPVTDNQRLTQPITIENGSLAKKEAEPVVDGEGPSVEHALSMSPTEAIAVAEPRKSIIGAKKAPAKKGAKV